MSAFGPEAVVSPQAEMDPEAGSNGTARRPVRAEGDFEVSSSRYITRHRFSVARESAGPNSAS